MDTEPNTRKEKGEETGVAGDQVYKIPYRYRQLNQLDCRKVARSVLTLFLGAGRGTFAFGLAAATFALVTLVAVYALSLLEHKDQMTQRNREYTPSSHSCLMSLSWPWKQ